jgi:hypothetical protein
VSAYKEHLPPWDCEQKQHEQSHNFFRRTELEKMDVPLYDGKDDNLVETRYCQACFTPESQAVGRLRRCSRCQLVHYCNPDCQKRDFREHKYVCKEVQKWTELTNEEGQSIGAGARHRGDDPKSLYDLCVGRFDSVHETMPYIKARDTLAKRILTIAIELETKEALNQAAFHHVEISRLCHLDDDIFCRYKIPFILLSLNRDEDACDFCLYWMMRPVWASVDEILGEYRPDHIHENSKEGDWIYPHEENSCYTDSISEYSGTQIKMMSPVYLFALCIIKMRLVAAHDARKSGVKLMGETVGGKHIIQVQSLVEEILVGGDEESQRVNSLREQIETLLDCIQANRPSMITAIMEYCDPNGPDDHISNLARRCILRVPGFKQKLVERFSPMTICNNTDFASK